MTSQCPRYSPRIMYSEGERWDYKLVISRALEKLVKQPSEPLIVNSTKVFIGGIPGKCRKRSLTRRTLLSIFKIRECKGHLPPGKVKDGKQRIRLCQLPRSYVSIPTFLRLEKCNYQGKNRRLKSSMSSKSTPSFFPMRFRPAPERARKRPRSLWPSYRKATK